VQIRVFFIIIVVLLLSLSPALDAVFPVEFGGAAALKLRQAQAHYEQHILVVH
jgi:hypothetical protein